MSGSNEGRELETMPPRQPPSPKIRPQTAQTAQTAPETPEAPGKPTFDSLFVFPRTMAVNNLVACIIFGLVVAGFVALSGILLHGYTENLKFDGSQLPLNHNNTRIGTHIFLILTYSIVLAGVFSFAYVCMIRFFYNYIICITVSITLPTTLAASIFMFSTRHWLGGVVFMIVHVYADLCHLTWGRRYEFNGDLLTKAIYISKHYGRTYWISTVTGVLTAGFLIWYAINVVAVYVKYLPGVNPACSSDNCSRAMTFSLIFFMSFVANWVSEWLSYTAYTMIAGAYACWFLHHPKLAIHTTRICLKRCLSASIGSICLGGLIHAPLVVTREFCSVSGGVANLTENVFQRAAFVVLRPVVRFLNWASKYNNRYALILVAIEGKTYGTSAKDAWWKLKEKRIHNVVNELVMCPALTMGAVFVATCSAFFAYLYLYLEDPPFNYDGKFTTLTVSLAFVMGLQIANAFIIPFKSGLETLLFMAAHDSDRLRAQHADIYRIITELYFSVQQAAVL